jgi:diadenosine tetraphosphate (Ap4A) HIT family hydrolase
MAMWNDPSAWKSLSTGATCPICLAGRPDGVIAELEGAYLTTGEDSGIKGYCCVVSKRHAVELHDLTSTEAAALMRDLQRVSQAVSRITGAVKLNYEIHGNTIPHLHVHVFPRYVGDAFEDQPIDPRRVRGITAYAPGEFAAFVDALRRSL